MTATPITQAAFTQAILDARQPVPEGLLDGQGQPAGRRFSVYRNNVAVSLTEALHEGFPVIAKLLGKANMDGLAGIYLRAHPPKSPLMMHYGEDFPDFLAGMEQLAHLGYLADVARLELAIRRSYHAADATAIDPDWLGAQAPETLMMARLIPAPAVQVVRSPWPIFDIWRFNTDDDAPQPQAQGQDVVVLRPEFDPQPAPLDPGAATFIESLHHAPLGAAAEQAATEVPDFDLGQTLALLLGGHALCHLTHAPNEQDLT